jgi:hypothetical protein
MSKSGAMTALFFNGYHYILRFWTDSWCYPQASHWTVMKETCLLQVKIYKELLLIYYQYLVYYYSTVSVTSWLYCSRKNWIWWSNSTHILCLIFSSEIKGKHCVNFVVKKWISTRSFLRLLIVVVVGLTTGVLVNWNVIVENILT